jgi:hypothetical protein
MKSFILALLPGLEEETGEFFDQVTLFSSGVFHPDTETGIEPA